MQPSLSPMSGFHLFCSMLAAINNLFVFAERYLLKYLMLFVY